jgi:hypothetical protein
MYPRWYPRRLLCVTTINGSKFIALYFNRNCTYAHESFGILMFRHLTFRRRKKHMKTMFYLFRRRCDKTCHQNIRVPRLHFMKFQTFHRTILCKHGSKMAVFVQISSFSNFLPNFSQSRKRPNITHILW